MTTVAVLGGGIGGLTAAHELAEREFDVTVYESRTQFGGKARSMPDSGSGTGGREDLPAEHGFRFFPGFYRHVPDTMGRIPVGQEKVSHHLVSAKNMLLAQGGGRNEIVSPLGAPTSLDDLSKTMRFIWQFGTQVGVPPYELVAFAERLLTLLCSCDARRFEQWENLSWWEFMGADHRSKAFQKFLADGMTRTLVAAKAREMSARTGGLILCQLMFDMARADGRLDRVLDGPTSKVWIDPWVKRLADLGVKMHNDSPVTGIECNGQRITGVTIGGPAGTQHVSADHYVLALPKERLEELVTPAMVAAEPRLAGLPRLKVSWMNGAMYYLDRDVELVNGHVLFIDSEWALTAISQSQFWPDIDLQEYGDGRVEGILSVDISDWERPGGQGLPAAKNCTKDQIRAEVWRQMVDHIDDGRLQESNVLRFFLDPAIEFPNPTQTTNLEPLLINTAGSWQHRPEAVTTIPNLFLAADFVRTATDLATMEAANEAARLAVNGILKATGSDKKPCQTWKPREPAILAPFRKLDEIRWRLGRPVAGPPVKVDLLGRLCPEGPLSRGLFALLNRFR